MSDGLSDEYDRRDRGRAGLHTPDRTTDELLVLANRYDTAAAQAFRARDDEGAMRLRQAADRIRELAREIPPLPATKR